MKENIIIFDFDGVIVDSFNITYQINKLARPTLTKERYQSNFNMNIAQVVHEDKEVREIDYFAEYGKRLNKLVIEEDVRDCIARLGEKYKLFIVSSTTNKIIKDCLRGYGLLDFFTEILGFDTETSKIKKFEMIFKNYDIPSEQAVFLTDTSGDINEAQEAGVGLIIGITGGYQSEDDLRKAEPDAIVNNFDEFFDLIEKS